MVFAKLKQWLFGTGGGSEEQKKAQAIKSVKDLIAKQEQLGKKYQNEMLTYKEKAKQFMGANNKNAARQALKQSKIAETRYVRALNTKENLSSRLRALEDASDLKETAQIFGSIQGIITDETVDLDAGTFDELQGEFEEQQDVISMANEALADTSGISEYDMADLDEELNIMSTEAELNRSGPLPTAGTEEVDVDTTTTTEKSEKKDDLDKELEGLLDSVND